MRIGDGNGCFQDYPDGSGWRTVCEIGIEFFENYKKHLLLINICNLNEIQKIGDVDFSFYF